VLDLAECGCGSAWHQDCWFPRLAVDGVGVAFGLCVLLALVWFGFGLAWCQHCQCGHLGWFGVGCDLVWICFCFGVHFRLGVGCGFLGVEFDTLVIVFWLLALVWMHWVYWG